MSTRGLGKEVHPPELRGTVGSSERRACHPQMKCRVEDQLRLGIVDLSLAPCPDLALYRLEVPLDAVYTNGERIDEVEALGVLGQDRREHARDNVAKLKLSTALTLHVTLSSPARQRCFPSIAPGLQIAMVSNSERAPGVALGDHAKQNCTRKLGRHPNCINNLDRSSESLRVRRSN